MEKLMEDFEKSNLEEKENNIEEKNRTDGCKTEECKNVLSFRLKQVQQEE